MTIQINVFSQTKLNALLGRWGFAKFEYLDSSDTNKKSLEKEANGIVVTFKTGGRFVTEKKEKDLLKFVTSGNFKLSDDNKYLYQDDKESEIITLTNSKLEFKIDEDLIMHFIKID